MRLAIFLLILVTLSACSPNSSSGPAPLRVGMELAYPPFEMTDSHGQPAGVSVDLANALGEHLGRPVEIRNIPFASLLTELQTGQIDIILSSMTATDERRRVVLFSEPYLQTGLCLLVGKDSPVDDIASLNQPGRRVAVKNGSTGRLYAEKHLSQAEVLIFDHESAAVLEVTQGRVDAFIYDQRSVIQHAKRHPETTRAIPDPFQKEYWAIALHQDSEALRNEINAFLIDFREQEGFERLAQRWLAEEKATFEEMGIPFIF